MRNIRGYRAESLRRKLDPGAFQKKLRRMRRSVVVMLVMLMTALVYFICFFGKQPIVPDIVRNKAALVHLISPFEFSYHSEIQTEAKRRQVSERIAPLYKINPETLESAEKNLKLIVDLFNEYQEEYDTQKKSENPNLEVFCEELSSQLRKSTPFAVNPQDIGSIYEFTTKENRSRIFKHAFFHVKNIIRDGIYDDGDPVFSNRAELANIDIDGSSARTQQIKSQSNARNLLLSRVKSLGWNDRLSYAIYRIFTQDILPNIVFDEEKTLEARNLAKDKVKPVIVKVREGETIIDSTMTAADSAIATEKLKAYKKALSQKEDTAFKTSSFYIELTTSFLLILTATLFLRISKTVKNRQPRTIASFCILLLFNLGIIRILVELGGAEYFDSNTTFLQIFKYGIFYMLSPMIQVLLFGPYTGFVMALLISALSTTMLGGNLYFFILSYAACLVAIFFCNGATSRSKILWGGLIYGLVVSLFSIVLGISAEVPFEIIWRQSLAALISGTLTSLAAITLLPLVERIFNRYSNIALIEFTDFNNPILRRLQIEAPGTYHHSVMVSYLAEHAASVVGANDMVCRVGALYHDIGKIVKPEFYTENQEAGKNLHDEQNPSMSALIIKSHVKEGMELAKMEKMPQQILDAIAQHHGTSIIMYFYQKAVKLAQEAGREISLDPVEVLRQAGIEESTYRHEGTKPQTIENAIIMLADSCEAASRSLKKVTQHGVEELVNKIVKGKMNDGQLDECPITVKQLSKIKSSFVFTMLNMLHSRVEYQKSK